MKILIVMPTYNEKENIESIIRACFKEFPNMQMLIVDDASPDNTASIVKNLQKDFMNLNLMERKGKGGLASAYIDGFKWGLEMGFDVFLEMDADFSHNPKYLPQIFEKMEKYDVVIGSRNVKGGKCVGWGLDRILISKLGSLYSRIILGCNIKDLTGGFNCWSKNALLKINLDKIISRGYSFQIEMKYRAHKNKLKLLEIPIVFEDRKLGNSKMDKDIFFEALKNVFKIRFS